MEETKTVKLPPTNRAGLPGDVDIIKGSAFLSAHLSTGRQARRGIQPTCP
jgi:hypothetical protein